MNAFRYLTAILCILAAISTALDWYEGLPANAGVAGAAILFFASGVINSLRSMK